MIKKPDFLNLMTATFDDISSDNNISKLQSSVTEAVPAKFSNLQDCGLLNNLLTQIVTLTNTLNDNTNSFKKQIELHKENIVNSEYRMSQAISGIPDVRIELFANTTSNNSDNN